MCLCWNEDGTMCSSEELKRRMVLYHQGLYKPELKAFRQKMADQRQRETDERVRAMTVEEKSELISMWKRTFQV